jgi:hypothetical protein
MEWQIVLILVIAIPLMLFPVAYVWYLNIGGIYSWLKERRKEKEPEEARAVPKKGRATTKA